MAAHNARKRDIRAEERWLEENIGDYIKQEDRKKKMAAILRREVWLAKDEGYKNVYSSEATLRQAFERRDPVTEHWYIGEVLYDSTPEGYGWEVWYRFGRVGDLKTVRKK